MPLPIHVDEYSGHRANQRPRSFTVDEQLYEIAAVLDQWYEPSGTYFKVQTRKEKVYLLRYDGEADEWTLQPGFDGDEPIRAAEHRVHYRRARGDPPGRGTDRIV